MCGRYYLDDEIPDEELAAIIDEANRRIKERFSQTETEMKVKGEIFPTQIVPILSREGPLAMKWGFTRFDGKGVVINARSEGLDEKTLFRHALRHTRCLVPASYYFEWETRGKDKIKYRLGPEREKRMYMAGIYRREEGLFPVFSILTREAAPGIRFIHDRMPVILNPAAQREWLAASAQVGDVIRSAESNVTYRPVHGVEQLSMF